jgi:O-antigen/teichoic acid export membrane protein
VFFGTILIPRYQMTGTALANILTVSLGIAVCAVFVKKTFGAVFEPSRVLKAALLSLLIGGLLSLWRTYPLALLPFVYAVGLGFYGLGMFVLGGVTPRERALLEKVLGQLRGARP